MSHKFDGSEEYIELDTGQTIKMTVSADFFAGPDKELPIVTPTWHHVCAIVSHDVDRRATIYCDGSSSNIPLDIAREVS